MLNDKTVVERLTLVKPQLRDEKNAHLVLLVCLWSPQATLDFPFHLLPQHTDSRHPMSL